MKKYCRISRTFDGGREKLENLDIESFGAFCFQSSLIIFNLCIFNLFIEKLENYQMYAAFTINIFWS